MPPTTHRNSSFSLRLSLCASMYMSINILLSFPPTPSPTPSPTGTPPPTADLGALSVSPSKPPFVVCVYPSLSPPPNPPIGNIPSHQLLESTCVVARGEAEDVSKET
jgi:hypothetical protein